MYYDADFEIIEKLATLGNKNAPITKELNIVQWGDDLDPRFDIRRWDAGVPLKGITLTEEEAYDLAMELNSFFRNGRKLPKKSGA